MNWSKESVLPLLQHKTKIAQGSFGVLYKVSTKDRADFCFKLVLPHHLLPLDLNVEADIADRLQQDFSKATPHLMPVLGHFDCLWKEIQSIAEFNRDVDCFHHYHGVYRPDQTVKIILMDYAPLGSARQWLETLHSTVQSTDIEAKLTSMCFQIAWTLRAVHHKYAAFRHNDCLTNNILVFKTTDPIVYYRANDTEIYAVPTYGLQFRLADFDYAQIPNDILNEKVIKNNGLYGIHFNRNQFYDWFSFAYNLYSDLPDSIESLCKTLVDNLKYTIRVPDSSAYRTYCTETRRYLVNREVKRSEEWFREMHCFQQFRTNNIRSGPSVYDAGIPTSAVLLHNAIQKHNEPDESYDPDEHKTAAQPFKQKEQEIKEWVQQVRSTLHLFPELHTYGDDKINGKLTKSFIDLCTNLTIKQVKLPLDQLKDLCYVYCMQRHLAETEIANTDFKSMLIELNEPDRTKTYAQLFRLLLK